MTTEAAPTTSAPESAPVAMDAWGLPVGGDAPPAPVVEQAAPPATNGNGTNGHVEPAPKVNGEQKADGAEDDDAAGDVQIDDKGQIRDLKTGRFVPHAKFHQAREKAKTLEAELNSYREKFARADERLAVLNQALTTADPAKAKAQQPANPFEEADVDASADIFKALDQQKRRNAWLMSQLKETKGQTEAKFAANTIEGHYKAARAAIPDFAEAHAHLTEVAHKELELVHGVADKAERQKIIDQREREAVIDAVRNGQNPAERMVKLAQVRGWAKKAPAPAEAQKTAAEQKIEQIRNGQAAAGTLANAAGGASGPLTMDAFMAMSDDVLYEKAKELGKGNVSLGLSRLRAAMGS